MSALVVNEVAPAVLQHAGAGTDGDQYAQATAVTDVALLDSLPKANQEIVVTQSLEQANQWIDRANLGQSTVYEIKDFNAFVATVTEAARQKELSGEIVLKAQKTQRRAEDALGRAVRRGQEAGEIRTNGQRATVANQYGRSAAADVESSSRSPKEFLPSSKEAADIYAMADADPEHVTQALDEAEEEGNLSRSNVVRKIKNLPTFSEAQSEKWQTVADLANDRLTSAQIAKRVGMTEDGLRAGARRKGITFPADEVLGKTKRINGLDVLERIVASIEADESVLGLVEFESITPEQAAELLQRLTSPLRAINRMKNRLKEISGE